MNQSETRVEHLDPALAAGWGIADSVFTKLNAGRAVAFIRESSEEYQLSWPSGEYGINSLLQIGGRLNSGSAVFENRRDPGACCNQQT